MTSEPTSENEIRSLPVKSRGIAAGVVLLGALILLIRKTDSFVNPQFWAEDGAIFFAQAAPMGWRALFLPYAGYLHFLPRLIARLLTPLDPLYIPAAYNYGAAAVTLAVIWHTFSSRLKLPLKPLLALAPLLVTHSNEVFVSITNIQWCLALLIVQLVLLDEPTNDRQRITDLALLAICGLTGPFVAIFLPLFVFRLYWRRTFFSGIFLVVAMGAAAIQISLILSDSAASFIPPGTMPWRLALGSFGIRWIVITFLGLPVTSKLPWGVGVILASAIVILIATLVRVRYRAIRSDWRTPLILASACALIVASVLYKFRADLGLLAGFENGDRYFFLGRVFLLCVVILCINLKNWSGRIAAGLTAAAIVAAVPTIHSPPLNDVNWANYAKEIRAGKPVIVPINPPGFAFRYPP